jgi:hypothetical protein
MRIRNGRAHRIPGKTLGRSRNGEQRQNGGNKPQDRVEPHQKIIQPYAPIRVHDRQPVISLNDDAIVVLRRRERNLECTNRAFVELEGCVDREWTRC